MFVSPPSVYFYLSQNTSTDLIVFPLIEIFEVLCLTSKSVYNKEFKLLRELKLHHYKLNSQNKPMKSCYLILTYSVTESLQMDFMR